MRTPTLRSLLALVALLAGCHGQSAPPPPAHAFEITEISSGAGEAIAPGRTALVDYTGWLYEAGAPDQKGRVFDSSRAAGSPFAFRLGAGQVIAGWDKGVAGMKVHGRRRLVIPPDMAYGADGAGGVIPPNATLVFDIELLAIQ